MRQLCLSLALVASVCTAVKADSGTTGASLDVTGPQEVGTTSMPAGNYLVTEQTSGKAYSLMVSNKGTMILGPAPATVGAAAGAATTAPVATHSSAMKNMMEKGMQKGVTEMMEKNAEKSLGGFIK